MPVDAKAGSSAPEFEMNLCDPAENYGCLTGTSSRPEQFEKSPVVEQGITVKPKQIKLFVKPYCGWCHKATRWLDERGVDYEEIDVTADESAYDEMIRISGQDLAPVIQVDGEILADFGPDQLADFWSKLEKKNARTASN